MRKVGALGAGTLGRPSRRQERKTGREDTVLKGLGMGLTQTWRESSLLLNSGRHSLKFKICAHLLLGLHEPIGQGLAP